MDTNQNNSSVPSPTQPASSEDTQIVTSSQAVSQETVDALFPTDPSDTQTDPLTEAIEQELVTHIIENLEESKLTVEEAQTLAKEFLALLPFQDKHDLVQKLNGLSAKYNEAKAVYIKYAGPIEEEDRQRKIAEMASHIKAGNIDQALAVVKGGENANTGSSTLT